MIQNKCGAQDCKTCMEYAGNWCDFWGTKVAPDKWCEQWWGKSSRFVDANKIRKGEK